MTQDKRESGEDLKNYDPSNATDEAPSPLRLARIDTEKMILAGEARESQNMSGTY
eukprot:CAMPEP_0185599206 /NCGR_PEP_ID=MMETSP0434-20130131/82530_1 /TAXON_ID=626734 ORGANISM="Favella taraikaensis, Strain Fe Narragansett Bay" /NCGR_SAMPLE_ID=MMETSP0434 /ASSEMBLY_ACC=CAM_ASM_000379 /LENGTH=54 /DNA_ID=CAMNT_0028228493 /DNA_START=685 /DNA_END=849 /DNA_ORIENTATION=-